MCKKTFRKCAENKQEEILCKDKPNREYLTEMVTFYSQ